MITFSLRQSKADKASIKNSHVFPRFLRAIFCCRNIKLVEKSQRFALFSRDAKVEYSYNLLGLVCTWYV